MKIKTFWFFARKRSGIWEKERAGNGTMKNTIPVIVISVSLSLLTHTPAAASKPPTYRLHGSYAEGASRFSLPDHRVISPGDAYFPEESFPVERGAQQSAGLRYASSQKIGATRAAAGRGVDRVSENRQPGKLIPLPLSGSVMLLLTGTGLILLAGLGMKTCRRIISKIQGKAIPGSSPPS